MEIQMESVRENPLMDRRKITAQVEHDGGSTPSREDIRDRFSAENNVDTENVNVGEIHTGYGRNVSQVDIQVHEDFEYREDLEEETDGTAPVQVPEKYRDIVSGTITDAKNEISELEDPDYDALKKAEQENKSRTTFIDWLEEQ